MTLPNFMMIGVAKAGTTSFFRYLDQHPQVYMCPIKGTNYFGYEDAFDWKWHDEGQPPLLRHFPVTTFADYEEVFAGATDEIAIGEASPQYFRCPTAAQRIRAHIPDAKLIVSLRNPAERAYSGFLMRTRRGETVEDVYAELDSTSSHVQESFYYTRMKRFFECFPREQIHVIIFEEFKQDPTRITMELFDFLEIDRTFLPDTTTRHNSAAIPKSRLVNRFSYHPVVVRTAKSMLPARIQNMARRMRQMNLAKPPKLPADLRATLLELYREDIRKLEGLVERDLTCWLERQEQPA